MFLDPKKISKNVTMHYLFAPSLLKIFYADIAAKNSGNRTFDAQVVLFEKTKIIFKEAVIESFLPAILRTASSQINA